MSLPITASSPLTGERVITASAPLEVKEVVMKPYEEKRENSALSRMLNNLTEKAQITGNSSLTKESPEAPEKDSPLARMINNLRRKSDIELSKSKVSRKRDKCDDILQSIRSQLDKQVTTSTSQSPNDSPSPKIFSRRTLRDSPGSEQPSSLQVPKESSWTKEIENEFVRFARICNDDAEDCKVRANRNDLISKAMQISLILFGASSIYVASAKLQASYQQILQSILGGLTGITTGIYGLVAPTKKAAIASDSAVSLTRLARKLKMQVLLAENRRENNPLKLILEAEDTRDKILVRHGRPRDS